jgi:hypothetical protein
MIIILIFSSRDASEGYSFEYFFDFPCKKFLIYERLTESRKGPSVVCVRGRTLARASSRNIMNLSMERVQIISFIEDGEI